MTKTPAKIVRVEIARKVGRWGGYKVRAITERGAVVASYDAVYVDEARRAALALARQHGATFAGLIA